MILVPLIDLKFLNEAAAGGCRNFKSAALVPFADRGLRDDAFGMRTAAELIKRERDQHDDDDGHPEPHALIHHQHVSPVLLDALTGDAKARLGVQPSRPDNAVNR